jgi:hypothetical protein
MCFLLVRYFYVEGGVSDPTEESEWTRANNEESIRRRLMSLEGVVHNKYALSHLLNFMVRLSCNFLQADCGFSVRQFHVEADFLITGCVIADGKTL